VGVRELKSRATAILRDVRESGTEYTITFHGVAVAVLRPVDATGAQPDLDEEWDAWFAETHQLAHEIAKRWPPGLSAAQAVAEQRR
jgi:antitoxin (DNA-binding transcriptional repressor) of toxin-antitoxin stability system